MTMKYLQAIFKIKLKKWWTLMALTLLILTPGCLNQAKERNNKSITVSILPEKYFVDRISGNKYEVHVIIPPGANHEAFDPTPRQIRDLENSAVYFRIGYFEFEPVLTKELESINKKLMIVDVADGIELIHSGDEDHQTECLAGVDPHIWLSPVEVKTMVSNIYHVLVTIDPDKASLFEGNFNQLIKELDSLDKNLISLFQNARLRKFIIYHPALGYLARDYDLEQIPIEREGKNPSPAYLRNIIDLARKDNIRTVLIQKEFDVNNARAVANEINGTLVIIDPMAYNWFNNMTVMTTILVAALNP
jgi:zinc transport system substrate-binding protein